MHKKKRNKRGGGKGLVVALNVMTITYNNIYIIYICYYIYIIYVYIYILYIYIMYIMGKDFLQRHVVIGEGVIKESRFR